MHYADAVQALRNVPMFTGLDSAKLKLLAFSSAYLTFKDGENVCRQGDVGDCVFLIDKGEADVVVDRNEKPVTVARLGHHALIGEMGVLLNTTRSATIRAVGTLTVLRIEGDVFLSVVLASPETALQVMRVLSERLQNVIHLLEDFAAKGCAPVA